MGVRAAELDNVQFDYTSTLSSDVNGPLDLKAELHYDDAVTDAPIAVLMHVYSAQFGMEQVRDQAQRLRDQGFFTIGVAMRGRSGSDGVRDSGGLEIYDIYDAIESVKSAYAGFVDPTNVHITGYSGGGGNVMSALTKFPDTFRAGSSFYGMSDYGLDPVNGWYNFGADHRTAQLDTDIGNPNTGGDPVLDRYYARASNLASKNNPYAEIHLFANSDETISPPINHTSYRDNAVAAERFAGEFDNITVHVGDSTGNTYIDFDQSGTDDPDEQQNWEHVFSLGADYQASAEQWYVDRLLDGSIPEPVLHSSDELFVAGYVVTKPFSLVLGNGEDTAGDLSYVLSREKKRFKLDLVTSDLLKTGVLTVDTSEMAGRVVTMSIDGVIQDTFVADDSYSFSGFGDGQTLQLTETLLDPGDFGPDMSLSLGIGGGQASPGVVPEPSGLILISIGSGLVVMRRRR